MDKAQKSLVDTYFRKRKIAQEQSGAYSYKIYEYTYLYNKETAEILRTYENKTPLELSKLSDGDTIELIARCPTLINKFDLSKLNGSSIGFVLRRQPMLFKNFKPYLSKLDGEDIFSLLNSNPKLIKKFNSADLSKIDNNDIEILLSNYPEFVGFFDLNKLYIGNLRNILYYYDSHRKAMPPEYYTIHDILNTKLNG